MSDLISRQAAIDAIEKNAYRHTYLDQIINIIKALPPEQPENVQCKDCKYQVKEWRTDKRLKDKGYMVYGCEIVGDTCGYWALLGHDENYCSMAERRTDVDANT